MTDHQIKTLADWFLFFSFGCALIVFPFVIGAKLAEDDMAEGLCSPLCAKIDKEFLEVSEDQTQRVCITKTAVK